MDPAAWAEYLSRLLTGNALSQPIAVAAWLGLADLVAGGPRHVDDLARDTGSHPDSLYRLMRALATIGSMSSSQVNDPTFVMLMQDTGNSLTSAVNAMATDVGVLGNTQANLTATQTQLATATTALTSQVSAVQNVDMATTLSNLTATQTQLQESYRLIASANSLSLINFLPNA